MRKVGERIVEPDECSGECMSKQVLRGRLVVGGRGYWHLWARILHPRPRNHATTHGSRDANPSNARKLLRLKTEAYQRGLRVVQTVSRGPTDTRLRLGLPSNNVSGKNEGRVDEERSHSYYGGAFRGAQM